MSLSRNRVEIMKNKPSTNLRCRAANGKVCYSRLLGALPLIVACGSESDMTIAGVVGADAGANMLEAGNDGDQPLYGLVSRITLPSGSSTVVAILDSLDQRQVDTNTALEIQGFASAHGSPALPGSIFVASAEAPELVRYGVSDSGTLKREASFSLAAHGLSRAPRSVVFVSATQAYAISVETYQLFIWNPTEMVLEQSIDLGMLERPGYTPAWVFGAALRGNELLVPVSWIRADDGDPGAAPDSAILNVDVETGVLTVHEEGRCGGLRAIYAAGASELYFSSSAGAPATWNRLYGERGGSEPCLVRLQPGGASTDETFLLRPSELSPHRVAVDFAPAGPSHLVFQALDESLISLDASAEELWEAAAWRFYSIPVSALQGEPGVTADAVDLPPSALNALRFGVDGQSFVPQISADYSETTVVNVTDPARPSNGPTIQGSVGGFFRVR
jgi:hypothetical protein